MASTSASPRQSSINVRVHAEAYEKLRTAAALERKSLTRYMDDVAEREADRAFWDTFRASVARLRADTSAWEAYRAESAKMDGTVADGLGADEDWSDFVAAAR